jgi:Protein of unknown function (DUF1367).
MELYCRNTLTGLVPLYPSDQDEKRKLKLGQDYKVEITNPRNLGFHKKFMALINVGCENSKLNMPFDTYRRFMTIKAGYFKAYQTAKGMYYEAMSISFASMEQDEFEEVYSRVLDKIIDDIGATSDEIEKQLVNFM